MAEDGQGKNNRGFESVRILRQRRKDGTFGEILDDWKWIFKHSAAYKSQIILYTAMGILSTTFGIASSIAGKYLIDIITGYETSKLWIVAIIMVTSSVGSLLFSSVISRISAKLNIRINNDIQAEVYDSLMDADWLELNRFANGDMLNRFNTDIGTVSSNAVSWLPTIIIALYNFVATFLVLLYYDVTLALIALASAPVMLLSSRFFIRKQREYAARTRETNSELMSFESETFYNMDTVKSFGIAENFSRRMRGLQQKYKDISLAYNLFTIRTNVWLHVLSMLVSFAAFAYCLYALWTRAITYGTMTLFLQQRSSLSGAFSSVVGIVPSFLNSSVSAHRIRELTGLKRESHIEADERLSAESADGFTVEVRGVTFAYREGEPVIKDSDFLASPGEIVALVGPSGDGKTTMIRLMLGLITPQEGEAVVRTKGGTEVRLSAETRQFFSYVPQGNTIISGTIADNVRMVKEDAADDEVINALKTACAWKFVEKLPDGINARAGEKGKGLSEGQAQRVAISRAVLRDAPVMLLDEATSALDVQTERDVLKNIIRERPDKTIIVTTHRPSVLSMCSRVYRVVDGKLTLLDREESEQMVNDF